MEGNNGKGNIVERDVWQTPQELFDKLDQQYNFMFDCCANIKNRKCEGWSDDFEKIDKMNLMSWMNPPFSKASEMFIHFVKVISQGVAIYRCDNLETKVWQDIILPNASWILIPKGRINYEGFEGIGARFASALIGFGVEPPNDVEGKILLIQTKGQ